MRDPSRCGLPLPGSRDFDAVDEIPVAPQLRAERARAHRPDSAIVLAHLNVARSLPASVQGDLVRLGRKQAERYGAVGMDFGETGRGAAAVRPGAACCGVGRRAASAVPPRVIVSVKCFIVHSSYSIRRTPVVSCC